MRRFGLVHRDVLTRCGGSFGALAVYSALASYVDSEGSCWPSQETLATDTGLRVRSVQRAISKLEGQGLLSRERRFYENGKARSTRYVLPPIASPDASVAPCQFSPDVSVGDTLTPASPPTLTPASHELTSKNIPTEQTNSCAVDTIDLDKEQFQLKAGSKANRLRKSKSPTFEDLMEKWNAIPDVTHCRKATESRKRAFRVRSKDPDWITNIDAALEQVAKSPFLRGQSERGWKADIDWFLKPDSMTRILEGKYDDGKNDKPADGRKKPGRYAHLE